MSSTEKHDDHSVNVWWIFALLVLFTAAEVGTYMTWKTSWEETLVLTGTATPYMSKPVMVMVLMFILTLPKAAIVMIYFMHLKFEKQLIIALAVVPLLVIPLVFSPPLVDANTLNSTGISNPKEDYSKALNPEPQAEGDDDGFGDDDDF